MTVAISAVVGVAGDVGAALGSDVSEHPDAAMSITKATTYRAAMPPTDTGPSRAFVSIERCPGGNLRYRFGEQRVTAMWRR